MGALSLFVVDALRVVWRWN